MALLGQLSCRPKNETFFMRYASPDPNEMEESIASLYDSIAVSKSEYKAFNESIVLAEMLTIMKREREAIKLLLPYIKQHPAEASNEDIAWLYLNYATANQYNNNPDISELYFKKAVVRCNNNLESVEHFVYHHYGRLLVEKGEYEPAMQYFNKALSLRQKLNDSRVTSTKNAIDSLNAIIATIYR